MSRRPSPCLPSSLTCTLHPRQPPSPARPVSFHSPPPTMSSSAHSLLLLLLLMLSVSGQSSASHLHTLPSSSSTGVITGHLLSPDTRTALHFTLHHTRSLLFLDDLHHDGVRLLSVSVSPSAVEQRVTLTLSGDELHTPDFLPSAHGRPVLCVPRSRLASLPLSSLNFPADHRHDRLHTHVFLSVLDAVSSPSSPATLVVIATPLRMRDVLTSATLTPQRVHMHPSVPRDSSLRRPFHVYGRHSQTLSSPSSSSSSPSSIHIIKNNNNTSAPSLNGTPVRFELNPFQVCFALALGFGPFTRCDMDLYGVVHDAVVPLPVVVPFSRSLSSSSATASANLSISMAVEAFGSFVVTENLLNLSMSYLGNISLSVHCPIGCILRRTIGEISVPQYHTLLSTPGTGFQFPAFPGFRLDSDISVSWAAMLMARAANVSSLAFRQPFAITATAGFVVAGSNSGDPALKVTMPTPMEVGSGIVLGHTTDAKGEEGEDVSFGRGPWGGVSLSSVVSTKFRDSGTVIEKQLRYRHGVHIVTNGRDSTLFTPLGKRRRMEGDEDVCGGCHRRRVRVKPFFEKVTGYMRTTDKSVGFNNTDFDMPVAETGKPLLVCVGAVACTGV